MRTPPLSYMSVDISEGGCGLGCFAVMRHMYKWMKVEMEGGVSCCFLSFI